MRLCSQALVVLCMMTCLNVPRAASTEKGERAFNWPVLYRFMRVQMMLGTRVYRFREPKAMSIVRLEGPLGQNYRLLVYPRQGALRALWKSRSAFDGGMRVDRAGRGLADDTLTIRVDNIPGGGLRVPFAVRGEILYMGHEEQPVFRSDKDFRAKEGALKLVEAVEARLVDLNAVQVMPWNEMLGI